MFNELRRVALDIFRDTLVDMDAASTVRSAFVRVGDDLRIGGARYDLRVVRDVYVVAIGKAAAGMARALNEVLADRIRRGILAAPPSVTLSLSPAWEVFAGGHPATNEASLAAGRAALAMMEKANREDALVVFLVSGGGSAMFESPLDERTTLADLRLANELLVTCGAPIDEVNFLRACFSGVKDGRLAARAPQATQATLIVSDTNPGSPEKVASGVSLATTTGIYDAKVLLRKYDLERRLPASIREAITNIAARRDVGAARVSIREQHFHVLLDQTHLVRSAMHHAAQRNLKTGDASDLIEQPIGEGTAELVRRLANLRQRGADGNGVCIVSAGEFRCPVRGEGSGGRNSETVLRAVIEAAKSKTLSPFVVLSCGTDGIDGNSPAAGAIGDETTLLRARERGMDAEDYLRRSDSYTFFQILDDAILTGATGTNVRDLRLLLTI